MKDKLYEIARNFRHAIESLDATDYESSSHFKEFPKGCCGDSSDLLRHHLYSVDITSEYICGMDKNGSHAWLESNGFIIDITADQFDEINERIIITKDRRWHSTFKNQHREKEKNDGFNKRARERLMVLYQKILKKM